MANNYWNDEKLVKNVIHALVEGEGTDWTELIVEIHVPDSEGRYIPRTTYCLINQINISDYPFEVGSDEEVLAFDELLELVDEELQEVAKRHDLLLGGLGIHFGWHDGEIRTVLYQEEGN